MKYLANEVCQGDFVNGWEFVKGSKELGTGKENEKGCQKDQMKFNNSHFSEHFRTVVSTI